MILKSSHQHQNHSASNNSCDSVKYSCYSGVRSDENYNNSNDGSYRNFGKKYPSVKSSGYGRVCREKVHESQSIERAREANYTKDKSVRSSDNVEECRDETVTNISSVKQGIRKKSSNTKSPLSIPSVKSSGYGRVCRKKDHESQSIERVREDNDMKDVSVRSSGNVEESRDETVTNILSVNQGIRKKTSNTKSTRCIPSRKVLEQRSRGNSTRKITTEKKMITQLSPAYVSSSKAVLIPSYGNSLRNVSLQQRRVSNPCSHKLEAQIGNEHLKNKKKMESKEQKKKYTLLLRNTVNELFCKDSGLSDAEIMKILKMKLVSVGQTQGCKKNIEFLFKNEKKIETNTQFSANSKKAISKQIS